MTLVSTNSNISEFSLFDKKATLKNNSSHSVRTGKLLKNMVRVNTLSFTTFLTNVKDKEKITFPKYYHVNGFTINQKFELLIYKTDYGYSYSYAPLSINIEEDTLENLKKSFLEIITFLKQEYGMCSDDELGITARELKKNINKIVS